MSLNLLCARVRRNITILNFLSYFVLLFPFGFEVASSSTPKLEDFFGGATMGSHHYESNGREAMALSLDSIFCHQNPTHEPNNQPFAHFSSLRSREGMLQDSKVILPDGCNLQQQQHPPAVIETKNSGLNWAVPRNYAVANNGSFEQKMVSFMSENGGESGPINAMAYGDLHSLSLSMTMSPSSQSSCVTATQHASPALADCSAMDTKKRGHEKLDQKQIVHRKSLDTFGQRTSQYRGVTRSPTSFSKFFTLQFFLFLNLEAALFYLSSYSFHLSMLHYVNQAQMDG